jgi:peptidoglycan/LPS O-acetylase OafA/YrhL
LTAIARVSGATRVIPALDGVRGLAVLTVMILHFTIVEPTSVAAETLVELIHLGWAGVDLFFVLSGFLITGILLDSKDRPSFFRNFYARRALRIFPLFYVFLLAVLVVWPAVSGAPADSAKSKFLTAAYLGNFLMAFGGWEALPGHTTHLWSLAVEEQFYLIWPFVVYLLPRQRTLQVCVAMIIGAWFLRLGFHSLWPTGAAGYVLLPARADTLAAGGILAILVRQASWQESLRPWVSRFVLAGVLLLLFTILLDPVAGDGSFTPLHLHVQLLAYPGVMALSLALVLWAVLPNPTTTRHPLLESRLLRRFGQISYGMYLLHIPLRNVVVHRLFPDSRLPSLLGSTLVTQALILVAGIALTYIVASASWSLFESPILRLKRNFETLPVPTSGVAENPSRLAAS